MGKSYYSTVSTGSNTTVKTGFGTLKSLTITPAAGTVVHVVDSVSIGATPNLNLAQTGEILRIGPFVDAEPEYFGPYQLGLNAGLLIAATSNARVHVEYE